MVKVLATAAVWAGVAAVAWATIGTADNDTIRGFVAAGVIGTGLIWWFGMAE